MLICEAGWCWRKVLKRLEDRMAKAAAAGYIFVGTDNIAIVKGWFGRIIIIVEMAHNTCICKCCFGPRCNCMKEDES